ncbi:hypothetical protein [Brasilonema bromeliae]
MDTNLSHWELVIGNLACNERLSAHYEPFGYAQGKPFIHFG